LYTFTGNEYFHEMNFHLDILRPIFTSTTNWQLTFGEKFIIHTEKHAIVLVSVIKADFQSSC